MKKERKEKCPAKIETEIKSPKSKRNKRISKIWLTYKCKKVINFSSVLPVPALISAAARNTTVEKKEEKPSQIGCSSNDYYQQPPLLNLHIALSARARTVDTVEERGSAISRRFEMEERYVCVYVCMCVRACVCDDEEREECKRKTRRVSRSL